MNKCYIYFHQGYTDIINCLSMIKYYYEKYNEPVYDYDHDYKTPEHEYKIILIVRQEVKEIVEYFCNDIDINIIYIDMKNWDKINIFNKINIMVDEKDLLLIHGYPDLARNDKYKNIFDKNFPQNKNFVKLFYILYDLDYDIRYKYFIFYRNLDIENKIYFNFISKYGSEYIIYHDNDKRFFKTMTLLNCPQINVNGISKIMFDYIKVLENAKEIHVIDSVWGCLIYILDVKYKLFKHIKIYYYVRSHPFMFDQINLDNWIKIK